MKRTALLIISVLAISCRVVECGTFTTKGPEEDVCEVCLSAVIAGSEVVKTRSILPEDVESLITDVTLASYGAGGSLTDVRYYESGFSAMSLSLESGVLNTVYALVNMGDMSHSFPQSESAVPLMEYDLPGYSAIEADGFPMSGVLEDFVPESSDGVIEVERLFAKVCVRIMHNGLEGYAPSAYYAYNMCNKSLYVRQANGCIRPFCKEESRASVPEDLLDEADYNPDLNDRSAYQGSLAQSQLGPGPGYAQDTTVVLYVPENVQGSLLPYNDDPFGKVYEELTDIDGSSYSSLCTYLEFNARKENTGGYSGGVTYRYYLGADNTSDFSIERNKCYDLTLDFTENGFFVDSWKVSRGDDWNDSRILEFIDEPYVIRPGETIALFIHYHLYGVKKADSYIAPDDFVLQIDEKAMVEAGLDWSFDPEVLVEGPSGYKDFCVKITASEDAEVGACIPVKVVTCDGGLSDEAVISVAADEGLSAVWDALPQYVSQQGTVTFSGFFNDDFPLSVSLSDASKVSCKGLDEKSFKVVAQRTGKVEMKVSSASGAKKVSVMLDIKAPTLTIDKPSVVLNPDGETVSAGYRYLDDYGNVLRNINASAFDEYLLPVVNAEQYFSPVVSASAITMSIGMLNVSDVEIGLGDRYEAVVSAADCSEVNPCVMLVDVKDPFAGMSVRNYGAVDDYTLFALSGTHQALKTFFADEIRANQSFEYQGFVPDAATKYVSVALEPVWSGGFSNPNGVFKVEMVPSTGKIKLSCNPVTAGTMHSAGRHNMMLYVTNRHSFERIGRSCGVLEVYVHTAVGARAVFGSQRCSYNPYGNESFASVYNAVSGRSVYPNTTSSALIHYMDVSLEWMTEVSKVYVWNRMQTAVGSWGSTFDALNIVRPSVSDGSLDSGTRMLYSVLSRSDSRISVCGEKYGPRKGIGTCLYRALLQATYPSALTEAELELYFLGYDPHTGMGTISLAPCYTLHDMTKGSDMQSNKVVSRLPYHFCPSSCKAYVDGEGKGYHVIHFLEEIAPATYGWINLL